MEYYILHSSYDKDTLPTAGFWTYDPDRAEKVVYYIEQNGGLQQSQAYYTLDELKAKGWYVSNVSFTDNRIDEGF